MKLTETPREMAAARLALAESMAKARKDRGEPIDQFETGQIGRFKAELAELDKIHSDPRTQALYARMENEEAVREEAEHGAAARKHNREERELSEELERVRKVRLEYYRTAKRPGLSEADFNKEVWPALRRDFLAGEEDAVDRERREKSTNVF